MQDERGTHLLDEIGPQAANGVDCQRSQRPLRSHCELKCRPTLEGNAQKYENRKFSYLIASAGDFDGLLQPSTVLGIGYGGFYNGSGSHVG